MNSKNHLRQLIFGALMMALTVVLGRVFIIPIPWTHGNINLCDACILICALVLGPVPGAIVGGLGGLLLDLISGYSQYMFFSLIAHGLEGFIAGWLFKKYHRQSLALGVAIIVMVACYFAADSILYTPVVGALGIPTNLIQGIVGAIVALVVVPQVKKYRQQLS
ncbi:ECF transporter S component [Periweissella ghanensis]|uniref:Thiamine transporter HmpT n=1 Tax=Periweissella ghanensis TaxID=467997 RepID=A0ABM8Z9B0_9LACO|nr:ECF transporter S component [Periweissella ghanensis]MCM0600843.1 ECF transporter S component [Periweissella ghanensis]CAH0417741.1 Thiamine precursor transporter HmpT [Periweissella ghanensis]